MKVEAKTRSQLAKEYKVDYATFIAWLDDIDGLRIKPGRRILTPKQVMLIYDHLGNPNKLEINLG